ncbi:MAG: hypothetical protein HOQ32_01990 [Lysobacter sp.]|nr:hypothetical protein [Lysobacter sp.]
MELNSPVRVVVVDDNPTHLVSIANGLAKAGVPCIPHWYDIENNILVPPAPPEGYPYLRVLFTDLNIQEMAGANADPKSLASVLISEVLQPVVAPNSGPYSICLWTSTGSKAQEVSLIIGERVSAASMGDAKRPAPLLINIIEKQPFVPEKNEEVDRALASLFRHNNGDGPSIEESISNAISQDAQLKASLSWEARVSTAATQTINGLYQISSYEVKDDVKQSTAFRTVLAKIAIGASGQKNAKQDPARALDDGLADLFIDQMRNSVYSESYKQAVSASLLEPISHPPLILAAGSRNALNTVLHLETQLPAGNQVERGLVFDINTDALLGELKLGNRSDFLFNDMLFNPGLLERTIKSKAPGSPDIEKLENGLAEIRRRKDELLRRARVVLIEIGADCDHAQRKGRTIRFLLGVEIPEELSIFIHGPLNNGPRSESLRTLGPWELEKGNSLHLLVSLHRFTAQQSWLRREDISALYRLRKPLVDQLLYWYSVHSTRPGIMRID